MTTTSLLILSALFPLLILIISFFFLKHKNKLKKRKISEIIEGTKLFFANLSELENRYITHSEENALAEKWQDLYKKTTLINIGKNNADFLQIEKFRNVYKQLSSYCEQLNNQFIQKESEKYNSFFSNIDGKSLDTQQRTAVINDEDRILVLAGAGSGKTLTISAKVKYLCEIKKISPEQILLISFTKKSAEEMTERIQKKLHIEANSTTFHKLGLDIIKLSEGLCPDVADENVLAQFVHNFFETKITNNPELIKILTEFFAYYLDIPNNIEDFSSLGELYEEEKNADFETLKTKFEREKYIRQAEQEKRKEYKTLKNEKVKSFEETKIANFLFLNNINYEYEKTYPFQSSDRLKNNYHPDFYLTDYDIYLEHFGVTENFTVPWLSPVEEKKYLDEIQWKRSFHKMNNTKLIETYSFYNSKGILLTKLKELLIANNVNLQPQDFSNIFNTVYISKSNKYLSEFINLCCTFITLFKSNNYKIEELKVLEKNYYQSEQNIFLRKRTSLFLDVIKLILSEYQNFLLSNNMIDFSDMINVATDKIESGYIVNKYKYIIVDEYQDISNSRFKLLKAIAKQTNAKLFCVGDDWQSIFRFAGSDISLFTCFEKYFGYTKILKIEKTYRNSQKLIDEASRFILRNPLQLKKDLKSDKNLNYPLSFLGFNYTPTDALRFAINKIISEFGENSSILLLGRTNNDKRILEESGLFSFSNLNKIEHIAYNSNPNIKLQFLTVHKSKGLEADNVIILNFKNDKQGFPNQITDDKILNLVLTKEENFKFAEERRLFYVAITRTKNRTYILTDNKNPSPFFKEFHESDSIRFINIKRYDTKEETKCPRCKTGDLLKVEHHGKSFIACSNFPKCHYTLNDPTILLHPKRCPECGGFLVKRKNKNSSWFIGCTNYPYCTYTEAYSPI